MAWNGSGTFTRTNGTNNGTNVWTKDKNAGTKITSALHDTHDQDLATGINTCLAKDGQNAMTADLDMGGNEIINYGSDNATFPIVATNTYTPAFGSTGGAFSYSTQSGSYITIGDFVITTIEIIASLSGTHTGTLKVTLPFTSDPVNNAGGASIGNYIGITVDKGVYGFIGASKDYVEIRVGSDGSADAAGLDMSDVGTTVALYMTVTYIKS